MRKNSLPGQKLATYEISSENCVLGQILNIPIKHIKSITVWRMGTAAKGALIGAGFGALISGILTLSEDQLSGDIGHRKRYAQRNLPGIAQPNQLTHGQSFLSNCIVTVPIGAAIGMIVGFGKKKLKYYVVYGTIDNYNHAKERLWRFI